MIHAQRRLPSRRLAMVIALTTLMVLLPGALALAAPIYTVRPGDSLWLIAQNHGTTVAAIRSANRLDRDTIFPGQRLTLPGDAAAARRVHTVQRGDSLWRIATTHRTTVRALRAANGLSGNTIFPGQVLVIPGPALASRSGAMSLSATDLDLLARLVRAESEGEPFEGQVAVAAVVLNRVRSPRFPNTVRAVIYQAWQFEPVENGRIYLPAQDVHRQAVLDAASGWDPSLGALFFFNPDKTDNRFLDSLPVTVVIGEHVFAR